jgi:hypothetical protein
MESGKPIVVFTTFWDAQAITKKGAIAHIKDGQAYKIDIESDSVVRSIAISNPMGMRRIDCLCPTWTILKQYKQDSDWDVYTKAYQRILAQRKHEVAEYIDSLVADKVYVLCCWENTCNGANCHRKILFDTLSYSSRTKDLAHYVYRHGDNDYAKKEGQLLESLKDKSSSGEFKPFVSYDVGGRAVSFPVETYVRTANSVFFNISPEVSPVPIRQPIQLHTEEGILNVIITSFDRTVHAGSDRLSMGCSASIVSEEDYEDEDEDGNFFGEDDSDDLFDALIDDFGF